MSVRRALGLILATTAAFNCSYTPPTGNGSGGAGGGGNEVCGNGVIESGEQCDDGNNTSGDNCSASCQLETPCANAVLDTGEECDDGNLVNGDGCNSSCVTEFCGDTIIQKGIFEECDDGDMMGGDGCSAECKLETVCGDGVVEGVEQCDDMNTDDGDGCSSICVNEFCGDGSIQPQLGEVCDNGDLLDGDGCDSNCTVTGCGNGIRTSGEACDDGNANNGDGCNPTCTSTGTTSLFLGKPGVTGWLDGTHPNAEIDGNPVMTVHGETLYFAAANAVRAVYIPTQTVTTIAGLSGSPDWVDGIGANARFGSMTGIATDGTTLWIADNDNRRIRAIDLTQAQYPVATLAGSGFAANTDGIGPTAQIYDIRGMTYYKGMVYFVDGSAHVLRRFNPSTYQVLTLAGLPLMPGSNDGAAGTARFTGPRYLTSDGNGILYVSDTNGNKIRYYDIANDTVGTVGGTPMCGYVDGTADAVRVERPRGIAFDGYSLYFAEFFAHTIRQAIPVTGEFSTLSGLVQACSATCSCLVNNMPTQGGYFEGVGAEAQWNFPGDVAYDPSTKSLFVADDGNHVIRRIQ